MNKLKQNQKGFTLIELLVVIAIIGLLASVVLLSLSSARSKGRDAKRVSEVRSMGSALEIYYDSNNGYPTTASGIGQLVTAGLMQSTPVNPTPTGSCVTTSYTYTSAGAGTYQLLFCLESGTGTYGAGTHTLSNTGLF